jgi:type IV pilus biogenesis protein CpaD/CtpE
MSGRIRFISGAKLACLLLAAALAGLNAACSSDLDFDAATWTPAPPPANQVVHRQTALHLAAAEEPVLRAQELARLDVFLRQTQPSAAAQAELRAHGAPALAAAAAARLRAAGIPAAQIRHLPAEPDAPPGLDIRLDDVAVRAPRCTAGAEGGFGCASARALGLMVADPRDLERGEASGPAAADLPAAAVMRQRRDEVKPLPSDRGRMAP